MNFTVMGLMEKLEKSFVSAPQSANGITYFNLAFGDWNEAKKQINDRAITNNHDRNKILATVASTVLVFIKQFPDAMIYAQGSTSSRTRLYQMGIFSNWKKINEVLDVYGYEQGKGWQRFSKNVNYEAFLVKRK